MAIRKLEQAEWAAYFDAASKSLGDKNVTVEVASGGVRPLIEARAVHLGRLVYDGDSDVFEVQTADLDHLIHGPTTIYVDEEAGALSSVEVIDREGTKEIIILSEPLPLVS